MKTYAQNVCSALILVISVVFTATSQAADIYSQPTSRDFPINVYWGDTHLHTNMSVDANGMGNRKLSPDDAFRFAKGEIVRAHNGQEVKLRRPLDFLVVADHAVNIGVLPRLQALDPLILETAVGKKWLQLLKQTAWSTGELLTQGSFETWRNKARDIAAGSGKADSFFWAAWANDYVGDEKFRRSVWDEVCANADRHNDPGVFTAFIGYEWTPPTRHPKSPNFHRNIIFEGSSDLACQVLPFSIQDSDNVEDLWAYLQNYEELTGGKVLAIPHNGNLSSGKMFAPFDYDGQPIGVDYANTRKRWEPLYEITQYKGDAETHPILSPTDEFADFETWHVPGYFSQRPDDWEQQKQYEYARSALKLGLGLKAGLGVNPFKFGVIGSTDAHTGFTAADEDNFWGKRSLDEVSPHRLRGSWWYASSGYAAVWAKDNTRSSIFAAMRRKEVYATTGPRMRVRFFGGWDYQIVDAGNPNLAGIGYAKGVPMGSDLTQAPKGMSPTFLIHAVKDPDGANLDRVQVIKGWRDKAGELREKVYNVALSDGRKENRKGDTKPVGNTVDIADATYTNSIGDPELTVVWKDPDFNADELAFYYLRVLQIPTPRWTAYDAKYYGVTDVAEEIPMIIQERAYTSSIWYTP